MSADALTEGQQVYVPVVLTEEQEALLEELLEGFSELRRTVTSLDDYYNHEAADPLLAGMTQREKLARIADPSGWKAGL